VVARGGGVRTPIDVERSPGAVYAGRLLAKGHELAVASSRPVGAADPVMLELNVGEAGLAMMEAAANRLPALLETTVTAADGAVCRSTSPALLRLGSD
jgi:hypothetical protein